MVDYYSGSSSKDLMADILGADEHNKTFASALSASGASVNTSSSSKAVLAALRALQDKIRRLETERSQALDESTQLRLQLRNQEIEYEHSKQREQLHSTKSLQEAKAANERLLHDKNELEMKLMKLEEKNNQIGNSADELHMKIRLLEEEKHSGTLRIKELEHKQSSLEAHITMSQQKEKDLAQSLIYENRRHEDEMHSLQHRLSRVQDELGQYTHEKATLDAKLIELDQLVGQLLGLNETLVAQLSGRSVKTSSGRVSSASSVSSSIVKKKKKKTTSTSSSSKVPRAATLSTVAADAARAAKDVLSRPASKLLPVKTNDVEQLKALHKMYANMAKKLNSSPSKSKRSSSPSKRADSSILSSGSKRKTRMSGKKGILTTSASSSKLHTDDLHNHHHDVYLPKPAVSFEKSYESDHSHSRQHQQHHNNTSYYSETDASDYEDYGSRKELDSYLSNLRQSPNVASSTTYNSTPGSTTSQSSNHAKSNAELQSIISTLEDEFDSLNRQYRSLLNNVNADSNTVPTSTTTESIQAQAEEIVNVIQKLHHKGEQLRLLKSPQKN